MSNRDAFLTMIAHSEGTNLIPDSDDGYRALVGGGTFASYAGHPRKMVWISRLNLWSSAAGRYQILARTFDAYKQTLGLTSFDPVSQDSIAAQMIKERGALPLIDAGNIQDAIAKVANIWASLPGAGYHQSERPMDFLLAAYTGAGGTLA